MLKQISNRLISNTSNYRRCRSCDTSTSDAPLLRNDESSSSSISSHDQKHHNATKDYKISPSNTDCTKVSNSESCLQPSMPRSQQPHIVMFYDPTTLLELSSSLCEGYVTLLSQDKSRSEKTKEQSVQENIELAFASIVDGNVIDVCFGVTSFTTKRNANTMKYIKDAKDMINNIELSNNDETIPAIVVHAYCKTFRNIITMNDRKRKLNFITKCIYVKRIHTQTLCLIQNNFVPVLQQVSKYNQMIQQQQL